MAYDWNAQVIDEFRNNGGRFGGQLAGMPILLLTTVGAKTGRRSSVPVAFLEDGERLLVFASKAGSPASPGWFHNLKASPNVWVEVRNEAFEAEAEVLEGEERDRYYAQQSRLFPQFADYQKATKRRIPVVALKPIVRRNAH